jgi:predicted O-linked N-acetylglucosamine transferase (SPINDLY family)
MPPHAPTASLAAPVTASVTRYGSTVPAPPSGLPALLAQARALLAAQGLPAVLAHLRGLKVRRDGQPMALPTLLTTLASMLQQDDPANALTLAEAALAENPDEDEARLLCASVHDRLGDRAASAAAVLQVVQSPRARPDQVMRGANLLVRFGHQAQAMAAAWQAFEALGRPLRWASAVLYIAQRTASWGQVDQLTAQLRAAHAAGQTAEANESPRTHLNWCGDESANMAVLQVWSRQLRGTAMPPAAPPMAPLAGRRLRVGYLSSDFRDHPTARLILGVLRHHDHSQLDLHLFCSGWDDGSDLRRAVVACADQVHSVAKLSDSAAAALIRSQGIDVLVELNGPTRAHRLGILAQRPAPVQIGYLGWPGSYGGGLADYIVADEVVAPAEAGPLYPEQLIRLHKTYQANDHAREKPSERPTRAQAGLPAHSGPVLGVFNAINKIDGTVWAAWMRVLRAVPEAVLWLLDPGAAARQNIGNCTREHGVDPRRVVVAPRLPQAAHLARMAWCDLMLDPWPYGGHTSTTDALLAGVPVLALAGTNFASRVSGGLLAAAGLGAFVQPDVDSYVRMAIHLLRTPATLQRAKTFIAERLMASDLVDARRRTAQLESAYQRAAARAAAGQPPVQLPAPGRAALVAPVAPVASLAPAAPVAAVVAAVEAPGGGAVVAGAAPAQPAARPWRQCRVAVVTPYYRIEPAKLQRCCASVAAQRLACDHILVADGEPQALPDIAGLIHMVLPANVGNCGATPRGFGAQYAFAQGYDAVAFLDADNWYEPDHVEQALQRLEQQQLDVVFARRNVVFEDGQPLGQPDPEDADGRHVDTNCYVFSKRVAWLMGLWAMYPKEFGTGEDRLMRHLIRQRGLKTSLLETPTVWYETHWRVHYGLAGKTPLSPPRAPARTLARCWDAALYTERTGLPAPMIAATPTPAPTSVPVLAPAPVDERATARHGRLVGR